MGFTRSFNSFGKIKKFIELHTTMRKSCVVQRDKLNRGPVQVREVIAEQRVYIYHIVQLVRHLVHAREVGRRQGS